VKSAGAAASAAFLLAVLTSFTAACGKKGPPLAPLRLVPNAVTDVSARRTGTEVELRFALPTANANGPGAIDLDRVEIYAITVPPGGNAPANRDLMTKANVVGTIAVRPPAVEGEAPPDTAAGKRPGPGDRVTFVEQLTDDKQKVAAAPETPGNPVRVYVLRGISRGGRPGPPAPRVSVPLASAVAAPTGVAASLPTESAIVVDWTPPVAEPAGTPLAFNVYRRDSPGAPMNPAPLTDVKFEVRSVEYGKAACFVVRTVQSFQNVTVESDASEPGCLTPVDKFPPAPPKGLRGLAEDGAVNLVWEPNAEGDLGGYLILRGEGEGATLQPLTPQPIKDANYRDTTVKAGVRYTYAIVAVDQAKPRNESAPSAQEAVTAR
jgi:predicted small lipoprotein YifL